MEKPKLERCSDSGHEAHLVEDGLGYFVECSYDACFNTTEYFDNPEEAIKAWNERNKPKFDVP